MKINISQIAIFSFIVFSLLIFWQGLKKDNNYDTKNLIGSTISNFQLSEINDDDNYDELNELLDEDPINYKNIADEAFKSLKQICKEIISLHIFLLYLFILLDLLFSLIHNLLMHLNLYLFIFFHIYNQLLFLYEQIYIF